MILELKQSRFNEVTYGNRLSDCAKNNLAPFLGGVRYKRETNLSEGKRIEFSAAGMGCQDIPW